MSRECRIDVERTNGEGTREVWLNPRRIEQARQRLAQGPATTADLASLLGLCYANAKRVAALAGASCVRGARQMPLYHYLPEHEAHARQMAREVICQEPSVQRDDLLRAYLAVGPLSLPMIERALGLHPREAYRVGGIVADTVHLPECQGSRWTVYADRAHGLEGLDLIERDLTSLHDHAGRRVRIVEAMARGAQGWAELLVVADGQTGSLSRHLQTLIHGGLAACIERPPGTSRSVSRHWHLTVEGRRALAAHHEEVLVGLRPGAIPQGLPAHPRVTAWGHLWDRVLFAMRGAPSPAELAVTLGLHPVMASRLWTLALPHLPVRLQAACIVSHPGYPAPPTPRPPARPPRAKKHGRAKTTLTPKEPSHDLAALPARPAAQDGDDLLQQPHQPQDAPPAPCASERDGDPAPALADDTPALGGEASGGVARGDGDPAAPEAGELGAPSEQGRELAPADPRARGGADGASRGSASSATLGGQPRRGGQGASGSGPRPADPLTPSAIATPVSHAHEPIRTPERHHALQPLVPSRPNADVMRRLALARRAQAERAALRVEAGGLPWTLRPVPAVTGAWEIVESTLDADKRIFGDATARARLLRLASEGRLPPRTDGLTPTPPSRQEAHP